MIELLENTPALRVSTLTNETGLGSLVLPSINAVRLPEWLNQVDLDFSDIGDRTRSLEDTQPALNLRIAEHKSQTLPDTQLDSEADGSNGETTEKKNSTERLSPDRVDLHRHLEGAVHLSTLIELAEKYGVPFAPQTISTMKKAFEAENKKKNLESFINRLSTRWMRLLIAKIMISSQSTKNTVRSCLEDFYSSVIENAKKYENIQALNILFSPYNLSIDGDLSIQVLQARLNTSDPQLLLSAEEHAVYEELVDSYGWYAQKGVHWNEYAALIGDFRKKYEEIKVYTTISFRRDREYRILTNPDCFSPEVENSEMDKIEALFVAGDIDFVDICGLESAKYPFASFNPFIRELDSRFIPHTRHAGEVHDTERTLGYENLQQIDPAENRSKWVYPPRIIAHAVRLLDKRRQAQEAYKDFIAGSQIFIAVNATSNVETGLFPTIREHRFLLNYLENPEFIRTLVFFLSTDDPVIKSVEPTNSIGNEVDQVLDGVSKMRKAKNGQRVILSPAEFLHQLDDMIIVVVKKLDDILLTHRIMLRQKRAEEQKRRERQSALVSSSSQ